LTFNIVVCEVLIQKKTGREIYYHFNPEKNERSRFMDGAIKGDLGIAL
jgi:hypothetical protein